MRIAFATTWNSRCGVAVYSQSLVHEMRKTTDVQVVSLDPGEKHSVADLAEQLNQGDLIHIQHQYPFFGGMAFHRNSFRRLVVRLKRPLVVTVHELDLGEDESWLMRVYKPWFNSHLFGGPEIDRLIVHTTEYKDKLKRLGVPGEDIRVISEGVPSVDLPSITAEDAKAQLGLSGKRVLTIFGFIVRRKGYEVALDALQCLPDEVSLLIAGGCHPDDHSGFADEIKRRVVADGLSDRVLITDYLPDEQVPVVMAATDIVLAPFIVMSNSSSIHRAIAYGKPIIASDLPATREINARRQCLVLANAGDSSDMADRARGLLDSARMLKSVVSDVRSYAQEFSVVHSAQQTIAVYEELLV